MHEHQGFNEKTGSGLNVAYSLVWAPKAIASLSNLPKELSSRLLKKASAILGNPHPFLERMVDYPVSKLRIGDYRAFININEEKKELTVLNVKHRKHAYQ